MSPTGSEAPPVPGPAMEQAPEEAAGAGQAEKAASSEKVATPSSTPPAASVPAAPVPLPTLPTVTDDSAQAGSTTNQGSGRPIVDDGDLIEKEWVHKAKQIVEQTRDDPYNQSEALTVFKADYMKKRYGKAIKLNQ